MTGPGQPRTRSHPINAQTLTGVYQAVRMFSPCQFQVYISIGKLMFPQALTSPLSDNLIHHEGFHPEMESYIRLTTLEILCYTHHNYLLGECA